MNRRIRKKKDKKITEAMPTGTQSSDNYARLLFLTCRHWKKNSSTSATSILQMMKQNSLSLSAAKKLLRSCLPKPCTVCRKKSGKPYCCIISLT